VGEAVSDVSKLALLDVLLDGVEELLLGDLERDFVSINAYFTFVVGLGSDCAMRGRGNVGAHDSS
jgi:hypothetical protein